MFGWHSIFLISGYVRFARLFCGLIELFGGPYWYVLGYYRCILVLGTGDNNGHYCAETCRPYFTQLTSVRREGESVDYRVGIWSFKPV